ncbi:unnamed protein product [Rangifer tarandus platyrhynchus]|uniref:Uncharacterized protein n=1 Tax=Rangifer tarandus platyrhynchus TaxID=3082113 RepID=A0AC59YUF6_RANTA
MKPLRESWVKEKEVSFTVWPGKEGHSRQRLKPVSQPGGGTEASHSVYGAVVGGEGEVCRLYGAICIQP